MNENCKTCDNTIFSAIDPCSNLVFKPVDVLPSVGQASRRHAYILPDNSIWNLNHDGTALVLNGGGDINIIEKIQRNGVDLTVNNKTVNIQVPTNNNQLTNGSNFITQAQVPIERVQVNGTNLPINNKAVNILMPTATSDLTNNSGFITNSVANLLNYYDRSTINTMIASISTLKFEIVATLPATGDSSIIYLVPVTGGSAGDFYNEFIFLNGNWEQIGTTQIDLSNYYTKDEITALMADFATTAQLNTTNTNVANLTTRVNNTYTKAESDTMTAFVNGGAPRGALISGNNFRNWANPLPVGEHTFVANVNGGAILNFPTEAGWYFGKVYQWSNNSKFCTAHNRETGEYYTCTSITNTNWTPWKKTTNVFSVYDFSANEDFKVWVESLAVTKGVHHFQYSFDGMFINGLPDTSSGTKIYYGTATSYDSYVIVECIESVSGVKYWTSYSIVYDDWFDWSSSRKFEHTIYVEYGTLFAQITMILDSPEPIYILGYGHVERQLIEWGRQTAVGGWGASNRQIMGISAEENAGVYRMGIHYTDGATGYLGYSSIAVQELRTVNVRPIG